jgi:hypothetical protein
MAILERILAPIFTKIITPISGGDAHEPSILLEDGSFLLLESGDNILLE